MAFKLSSLEEYFLELAYERYYHSPENPFVIENMNSLVNFEPDLANEQIDCISELDKMGYICDVQEENLTYRYQITQKGLEYFDGPPQQLNPSVTVTQGAHGDIVVANAINMDNIVVDLRQAGLSPEEQESLLDFFTELSSQSSQISKRETIKNFVLNTLANFTGATGSNVLVFAMSKLAGA